MSPTGFEPKIPATAWTLESEITSLTIIGHRRMEQMPVPERHTNTRSWSARFIPCFFYNVGSVLLSTVLSLPALCVSSIYHFSCPVLTLAYILHGMNLSRNRQAVAKTYLSADRSNGSKGPCGSPVTPSMPCHWKKQDVISVLLSEFQTVLF